MSINLHNAEFIKSAASPEGFLRDSLPKIVFAGRSNAGKSSTINALLNRKNFARVSESPGKTIHINYFRIDQKLYLVDLPGYGFARAAKGRKEEWGRLMDQFFAETDLISLCVLIVDARHKPSAEDMMMCDYLKETGIAFLVAANKIDSLKKSELPNSIQTIRLALEIDESIPVIPYSARSRLEIDQLKAHLFRVPEQEEDCPDRENVQD